MDKDDYWEYLRSWAWRVLRARVLVRDGERCTRCTAKRPLTVHHLTYDRVGREELSDLVTLCWRCHRLQHPEKDYPPDEVPLVIRMREIEDQHLAEWRTWSAEDKRAAGIEDAGPDYSEYNEIEAGATEEWMDAHFDQERYYDGSDEGTSD